MEHYLFPKHFKTHPHCELNSHQVFRLTITRIIIIIITIIIMITIITNNMIVIRYSECTANPQGEDDQDSSCTSAQLKVIPTLMWFLCFYHRLSGSSI